MRKREREGAHANNNTDTRNGMKDGMRCEVDKKDGKPRKRTNW